MNHDDQKLIGDLFERMREVRNLDKDHDAEAFIHRSMRENADSPYLLVQSVLVQEQALQEAAARIETLERQIASQGARGQTGEARSSGFVGGGTSALATNTAAPAAWEAPASTSVPKTGAWGNAPAQAAAADNRADQKRASSAAPAQNKPRANNENGPNTSKRGGGFMAQAMTTAAGVAGGMLLANGISSMLGGASGSTTSETAAASTPESTDNTAVAGGDNTADPNVQNASTNDPGTQADISDGDYTDASQADDWGDVDYGGDDWGGDFDV